MAAKLKVTYLDDAEVEVVATPRAQVETERFLRQQGGFAENTAIEATYRLTFESLRSRKQLPVGSNGGDMGYEEWLDNISEVEELESASEDPTREAQLSTSSSD